MTTAKLNLFNQGPQATAIGSLPQHNVDTAMALAFELTIPFLPQIPISNHHEFMIPQALEKLPGLVHDRNGISAVNLNEWKKNSTLLDHELKQAFANIKNSNAFEYFEPSPSYLSCWTPFLWELEERQCKLAKIQLAGPLTSQFALKLINADNILKEPELSNHIYKLIMARSIAMIRKLKSIAVKPIFYIDEPGLYALSTLNPLHALALSELKILIHTLKAEGAIVGLHCCGNPDWENILSLELDIISLDVNLSLSSLLKNQKSFDQFIKSGGILSLGVISTNLKDGITYGDIDVNLLITDLLKNLSPTILKNSIYTPACGLAFHQTQDCDVIFSKLNKLTKALRAL